MLLAAYCFQCLAQITVAGKHVACDWGRGVLLTSVSEQVFGRDYEAIVNYDESIVSLTIGGELVARNQPVIFRHVDADATYPLVAQFASGNTASAQLQFSYLPVMDFSGILDKEQYTTVTVRLAQPDGPDLVSLAQARYRGGITNTSTFSKRGIHLKFIFSDSTKRDVKLFGLRSDNSWILDGGASDVFRVRNRVACDLWNDMATKPYYAAQEPTALSASRGQLIELVRDGSYKGIYNMCEALDRKQMRLKKTDEHGIQHGMLWKAANRTPVTLMEQTAPYDNSQLEWDAFETKYPDSTACYEPLHQLVSLTAQGSDEEFAQFIGQHLDLPVIVDHYIFLQTLLAFDNQGKNIYWACYDVQQSGMITPAVWDLDATFGQDWNIDDMHSSRVNPRVDLFKDMKNQHRFLERLIGLDVNGFNETTRRRYQTLRSSWLSTASLQQRFHRYAELMGGCGATRREEARAAEGNPLNVPIDFEAELNYIDQWIERHMRFLDCHVFNIVPDLDDNDLLDVADVNLLIDMVLGKAAVTLQADINGDGQVDVTDVNLLIDKLLGKTEQ